MHELHANEIVLLAYYIATINIESAYFGQTGVHLPFEGIVLTDTFQMNEAEQSEVEVGFSFENSERASRQKSQRITVVFSNPPYSAQQDSENDNNKNLDYLKLDARISATYAAKSKAKLLKNLYDSYARAIRWATDRVEDAGIVAFVTNGSFIDANNLDGIRKSLVEDFSHLYVINLRGRALKQGEERRKEGGGVFGDGSKTSVAITIMVKDPTHNGPCELRYFDIGDYLTKEEKLARIEQLVSIEAVDWQRLTPNAEADWAEQRDPVFETFMALGDKDQTTSNAIFGTYSLGVVTNRDPWVSGASFDAVSKNVTRLIETYEAERARYASAIEGKAKEAWPEVEDVVKSDPRKISWTRALKADIRKQKPLKFDPTAIVRCAYRPFSDQWLYFNRSLNEMVYQVPKLFPTPMHPNVVISSTGVADRKGYSALVAKYVPSMHLTDTGQCFPLYWYEKLAGEPKPVDDMFAAPEEPDECGYVRRDGITDWALKAFQSAYKDATIGKVDIFWYVYGVLHSPEYKQRFAIDLKKALPRMPFARDFWTFSKAGQQLCEWHLGYDTVAPFDLVEENRRLVMEAGDYKVGKMAFGKKDGKPDKSVIVYNECLILRGVPLKAYEYQVNGKSAIEWVMERYLNRTGFRGGLLA
jgi:predicted helicase